ncbi:MAG: HNH endonuclease [Clostridia bacterium]|nr:HNH endonuclease [Clostridia bacterium]
MNWMIAANGKMYDHASAFQKWGYIDWKQSANYEVNDIVYIYCTKPHKKVMYKTIVVETNKAFVDCQDDKDYWYDLTEYENAKSKKFCRIKLIEQVDSAKLSLEFLKEKGLSSAPQGPIRIQSEELLSYLDSNFNDYSAEDFFNDVDNDKPIYEGHKLTVQVDKYERSSIARGKCIEHYGCKCFICGLDFGNKYGDVGRDFIHVHHKTPLHTIKSDYCVDYKNDLIPVCPNCHAMLHRKENGKYLTIEELKNRIS